MSNGVQLTAQAPPTPPCRLYMYKNVVRTLEPPIYMYTSRVAPPWNWMCPWLTCIGGGQTCQTRPHLTCQSSRSATLCRIFFEKEEVLLK